MPSEWYYLHDDKQTGPLPSTELKALAANGTLEPTDFVWKEGLEDWVTANRLKGLKFGQPGTKPAPAPKPVSRNDPSFSNDLVPLGDAAVSDIMVLSERATSELLVPLGRDDLVPIDEAVIPIDQAVADDDIVPVEQAIVPPARPPSQPAQAAAVPAASRRPPADPGVGWGMFFAIGSALLVLSFAAPWWSMTVSQSTPSVTSRQRSEALGASREASLFFLEKRGEDFLDTLAAGPVRTTRTFWIWGWHTTSGICALLLGLLVLASVIVFSAVPVLRNWSWIVRFSVIVAGAAMVAVFFVWFFGAPDTNVDPIFSQGLILGPYLALLGGLILVAFGIAGGVAGVKQFNRARRMRQGSMY